MLEKPAWVAVKRDCGMKSVYERHINNGKKKKVAIVAIMRKLVIRANAAIRNHMDTDTEEKIS